MSVLLACRLVCPLGAWAQRLCPHKLLSELLQEDPTQPHKEPGHSPLRDKAGHPSSQWSESMVWVNDVSLRVRARTDPKSCYMKLYCLAAPLPW